MSWEYQLKVWIKKGKHYIECTCCHGGGKNYFTYDSDAGYPSNQFPNGEYKVESVSGEVINYSKKCEACDGNGCQAAKIEFFDYDTQVQVSSEGQFKLVP